MRLARTLRPWLILAAALSTVGCGFATRFAYNHLDWLGSRELGKYVDLTSAQEQWLEPRFEALWSWHRRTQLPRYAADLRWLAAQAADGLERSDIEEASRRLESHWETTAQAAADDAVKFLAQLSDAQVQSMLKRIDERNREYEEERVDVSDEQRTEHDRERARDWFEDRYGRLELLQKEAIEVWLRQRLDLHRTWQTRRHWWRGQFADALARRTEAEAQEQLKDLLFDTRSSWSEELRAQVQTNQTLWDDLILRIDGLARPQQREHLQEYLTELAEDFEALAADR